MPARRASLNFVVDRRGCEFDSPSPEILFTMHMYQCTERNLGLARRLPLILGPLSANQGCKS